MIAYYSPDWACRRLATIDGNLKRAAAASNQGATEAEYDIPDRPVYTGGIRQFLLSEQPETICIRAGTPSWQMSPPGRYCRKEQRTKVCIFQHPSGQRRKTALRACNSSRQIEMAPDMPAIITGDFNCTPGEEPLQTEDDTARQLPSPTVRPGLP